MENKAFTFHSESHCPIIGLKNAVQQRIKKIA
jgi:hypothetical protein